MIVASLGVWPWDTQRDDLAGIDAVELRLDLMDASPSSLQAVVSAIAAVGQRFIATCRPGRASEADRVGLLCESARNGAWAVDIEIDASEASRAAVLAAARTFGSRVIISHHDHDRTPSRPELDGIVRRAFDAGADLVKVACLVLTDADQAALLGLLDDERSAGRVAIMGMGPRGRLTRIVAPLLGSPLVYVSLRKGLETADGQPTRDELVQAWTVLGERP